MRPPHPNPAATRPVAGRWPRALGGSALLVAGLVLLPLPGPGTPLLYAGLAVLAPTFPLAGRTLVRLRALGRRGRPGGWPVPARAEPLAEAG